MQLIMTPQRLSHFALAILLCVATQAAAQAGHLDTTFANKGVFAATSLSEANAVAIQKDGKIVVAGTGANNGDTLIRLNTDGTLDSSFGSGGIANFTPQQIAFGFFALAIQSDGKIVAAADGALNGREPVMQAARVNTDGSLDTSFGSGGFTGAIDFPLESGNLALQADGKILVAAGLDNPNGVPSEMARFTASGQTDTTFGGGAGVVNLAYPGPTQIAVQSSGKILVASGGLRDLYSRLNPPHSPVPSPATTPTPRWTRLLAPRERQHLWPRPRLCCCKATARSWSPVRSPASSIRRRQETTSASESFATAPMAPSIRVLVREELPLWISEEMLPLQAPSPSPSSPTATS